MVALPDPCTPRGLRMLIGRLQPIGTETSASLSPMYGASLLGSDGKATFLVSRCAPGIGKLELLPQADVPERATMDAVRWNIMEAANSVYLQQSQLPGRTDQAL